MSTEECKQLKAQIVTLLEFIEKIAMKWCFLSLITLVPLLVLSKKIPSTIQLTLVIFLQIFVIVFLVLRIKKDPEIHFSGLLKAEIERQKVEVVTIKSHKVVKRKDAEDFGSGYYFDIGENNMIFLQGQYLDVLHSQKKFPNSEFSLIRTPREKIFIACIISGIFLKPLKTLPPFSAEQYKKETCHRNGQIITADIDTIN